MSKAPLLVCFVALFVVGALYAGEVHAWVDDYDISVSAINIEQKRKDLRNFIWGTDELPTTESQLLGSNVASPVSGLENLERVEKYQTSMSTLIEGFDVLVTSYHLIPARKRNRLVIVYQGHGCPTGFNDHQPGVDGGLQHTIKALLRDGYGVVAIYMPLYSEEQCVTDTQCVMERCAPDECLTQQHACLFSIAPVGRSGAHFFLQPTAEILNYLQLHYPSYRDFNMLGLSGGGWTTTLYAAIDPRIKVSIPASGSVPLYLRKPDYVHDEEQFNTALYGIAGYLDLYILGSYGAGRAQIQVLNRSDPCCFGTESHSVTLLHVEDKPVAQRGFDPSVRLYESRVRTVVKALGAGSFRVVIDDIPRHTISDHTIQSVIRPALNLGGLQQVLPLLILE